MAQLSSSRVTFLAQPFFPACALLKFLDKGLPILSVKIDRERYTLSLNFKKKNSFIKFINIKLYFHEITSLNLIYYVILYYYIKQMRNLFW